MITQLLNAVRLQQASAQLLRTGVIMFGIFQGLALASCSTVFGGDSDPPALRLASDGSADALAEGLLNAYETAHLEIPVTLVSLNRGAAISAVTAAEVDAALILMPPDSEGLFHTPIGMDMLVVITHPENPVTDLSIDAVRAIFTGQIMSWAAVGGREAPVEVIVEAPDASSRIALHILLLGGRDIGPTTRLSPDAGTSQQLVAGSRHAIGWVPLSGISPTVQPLSVEGVSPTLTNARDRSYPFTGPVVFVALKEPDGALRDFLDWVLSAEGQRIVRRFMLSVND